MSIIVNLLDILIESVKMVSYVVTGNLLTLCLIGYYALKKWGPTFNISNLTLDDVLGIFKTQLDSLASFFSTSWFAYILPAGILPSPTVPEESTVPDPNAPMLQPDSTVTPNPIVIPGIVPRSISRRITNPYSR